MKTKNKTKIPMTSYRAIGIAEGFIESDSLETTIEAWAYIARTGMYRTLQGFFGRNLQSMVDDGFMDWEGNVNWDRVEELN